MKPVMYIVANAGANMSHGKLAAQVAHAAVEAYRLSCQWVSSAQGDEALRETSLVRAWYEGDHYTKIVLGAADAQDLLVKERYINDRGFRAALIIDEGRTEIAPFTPTALGVEIVDKDEPHVLETFSSFKTYKHPKPEAPAKKRGILGR